MSVTYSDIVDALKQIYDPEIPVNIVELGLIYGIDILENEIVVTMSFTSPTCPMMEEMLAQIKESVMGVAHGAPVRVELVWDSPWNLSMMSDTARLDLDLTNQGW
ncbi:MAG: DUF59 domain-containing protein [Alphaproteobacteria bacterium]|nr:DUF59 domain-containing protein [Alphaproteobacteria bacterium]